MEWEAYLPQGERETWLLASEEIHLLQYQWDCFLLLTALLSIHLVAYFS